MSTSTQTPTEIVLDTDSPWRMAAVLAALAARGVISTDYITDKAHYESHHGAEAMVGYSTERVELLPDGPGLSEVDAVIEMLQVECHVAVVDPEPTPAPLPIYRVTVHRTEEISFDIEAASAADAEDRFLMEGGGVGSETISTEVTCVEQIG